MSGTLDQEPKDDYRKVSWGPREEYIPLDWDMMSISDISENVIYPQRDKPKDLEGDIPWIRIEDLDGKYISESDSGKGVTQETVQEMNLRLFPPGTLMCSCSGNMGICAITGRELVSNQTFAGIVPSENIHTEYLYYTLENLKDDLQRMSTGTTIPYLSSDKLKKFEVPCPPLAEQCRIADILSTVDDQVQQSDEIIETAKEVRHGLRKDLVFGKGFADDYKSVRLGARNVEIPSDWEVATFSDVAAVEKGNTPKTSNSDYYGGDIVWVTPDDLSNMYERGEKYISDSRRKITDAGLQSTSVNIVPAQSVMFTSRSYGIGKTAICTVPAATNQGIIAFHPREKIGVEYLYYYLNQIMDYIIAISGVSNFPEVSLTDIRNLRVPVPSKDDQERIESVLQLVDERLVAEQNTKRRLQELKRGLMQDLLTGKVRVNTD